MWLEPDLERWARPELERELARLRARESRLTDGQVPATEDAVSWRATAAMVHVLDRQLGAARIDGLLGAAGLAPAAVRARRTWMSWREYERVLRALDPLIATGEVRRACVAVLEAPSTRFLTMGVRTLPSIDQSLRWLTRVATGPGGVLFRAAHFAVRRRSPTTIEVRITPPLDGELPDAFVEGALAALGALPRWAGSTRADARAVREGRTVAVIITHDPPGRLGRLRSLVASLRSSPIGGVLGEARSELAGRNAELRRRIDELEASERARQALDAEVEELARLEAVGRLAGGVAHDFNNLLTVVLAQAERLQRMLGPHADLSAIEQAGKRAAVLCRQLLTVARQEHMRLELLELSALVAEREELLRAACGEPRRVVFRLARTGAVRADATSLDRVLLELVANAREAMPTGGELSIQTDVHRARDASAEGSPTTTYARLLVKDQGRGMSAEVRACALEPFFTTRTGAQGLGLPAVFGTVRQLGGLLRVRSAPGVGTEVEILLPVEEP